MLRLVFLSLVTLSSLFVSTQPSIAFQKYKSKDASYQNGSLLIKAKLSYLEAEDNNFLTNFKVRITRNKQTILDSELQVKLLPTYDKELGVRGNDADIEIIELDGNGEPEVLVDLTEAGAHCCASTFIYSYDSKAKKYLVLSHFWGNYTSGYNLSEVSGKDNDRNLPDLNKDGSREFVALDDRFRGEFGGYAVSAAPVQIWRYHAGKMVDVTREFPKIVYQNTSDLGRMYNQIRSEYGVQSAQGAMAAYVASKFLLGQEADAMRSLRQGYSDSSGKAFTTHLMNFLRQTGYAQ